MTTDGDVAVKADRDAAVEKGRAMAVEKGRDVTVEKGKPVGLLPGLDAVLAAHRSGDRPMPVSGVDADGRLIPETPERAAERRAAILAMLAEIGEITDETDTEEVWRGVMRDIDGGRPHRPLFGGMY